MSSVTMPLPDTVLTFVMPFCVTGLNSHSYCLLPCARMHIKQERLRQEWMEQQGSHIQPGHVEHTPYDRRSPGGDYETRGVRERRHQSPEYVAHERSPRGLNEFGLRYGVSPPAARPLPYGARSVYHTEAETKWPTFYRRHFQLHFLEWKSLNFY